MANNCPECGREVQVTAKLCVDCGFHFEQGVKISRGRLDETPPSESVPSEDKSAESIGENRPAEINPYAPPDSSLKEKGLARVVAESDLPKLRRIAGGAIPILISFLLLPCVCFPLSTLLLPLSVYRLLQWWQLYQEFENLRSPNSLSPHVELELQFQWAFWQYIVSILLGITWLAFFVFIQLQ